MGLSKQTSNERESSSSDEIQERVILQEGRLQQVGRRGCGYIKCSSEVSRSCADSGGQQQNRSKQWSRDCRVARNAISRFSLDGDVAVQCKELLA
ncbi:hypothetical protein DVH24_031493 [Malus domestica]|uniref:Uncharacterized protein n=1 Tax=Malus domestica TaxID=3750 RepID=A0A498HEF1_MALDO|nr:hypothetical protein DVH24_031493 [Malus domestica]